MAERTLPERYRGAELIARGGMGEVYRAEDADLARVVAVKVLGDRFADDLATRGRFTREALAAARLSNAPATVTIFDVGEHAGRPYIVMEYMPGGSLDDRLHREGAQPLGRALEWLAQAAAALDAAHANGIVHRDVKPANLLLDESGNVKVGDFGVASAAGLSSYTEAGTVVGTAGYLAPEQARGERATAASDVYALAVVAFELLTGSRPYERDSTTAEAMAHVSAPIPPASDRNPALPPQVDDVLARGLAKNPAHRFASAGELVAALRDAVAAAAPPTQVFATSAASRRERRRVPLLPVLLGAALLAGILAAALLARDDDPEATPPAPPRTLRETVTLPGTTVVETIVTTAPAPPPATTEEPPPTTTAAPPPSEDPVQLNDQGYALMQQGRYEEALPLLERSVSGLSGSGSLAEAYASYNLAFTRRSLGRCDGVADLLNRSEQVQGERKEITRLRRETERACG